MNFIHTIQRYGANWLSGSSRFAMFFVLVALLCARLSYQIENDHELELKYVMSLALAPLLSLMSYFLCEQYKANATWRVVGQLCAILLTGLYFVLFPDTKDSMQLWPTIVFGVLIFSILMMLCLLPFVKQRQDQVYLKFNMQVFENFLESLFMTAIIFAAISLAVISIDALFNTKIGQGEFYGHTAVWAFIFINSVNFLSSYPKLPVEEATLNTYQTRFYKIFTNYISVPVIIIYAIILYAYAIKIAIDHEALKEWTSGLCTWYFITGTFTYLSNRVFLVHNTSAVSSFFCRYFFAMSVIPAMMFFYAVYDLIQKKGIEEDTYYLALFWVASALIVAYFLISRSKDLRTIALVLLVLAMFSIFPSPMNVWNLPLKNQSSRVIEYLEKNKIIQEGKLIPIKDQDIEKDISINSSLYFLERRHQLKDVLEPFDKDKIFGDSISYTANNVMFKLGLDAIRYDDGSHAMLDTNQAKYISNPHYPKILLEEYTASYPVLNLSNQTSHDFSGLIVNAEGKLDWMEGGKIVSSFALLKSNIKGEKIVLSNEVKTIDVYFIHLSYRSQGDVLLIDDIQAIAFTKK